jgi:uncharacterized protein DUF2800
MADAHSRLVGGSIASRRIECPASFQEGLKQPPGGTSSIYADHGTACHEAVAVLLKDNKAKVIGQTFYGITITDEDFDNLIDPALQALEDLEQHYGGSFEILHVEYRAKISFLPGAFGTIDIVMRSKDWLLIVDFKFGAGVQVTAVDASQKINAQTLFYLSGVEHLVEHRKMAVAIIQPTFEPTYSHAEVTPEYLGGFQATLTEAIVNSLSSNPRRARGEWCRFAECKATCPLWTGFLLDLSALGKPPVRQDVGPEPEWGLFLARAKRLVDSAIQYKGAIDDALMEHLRMGGKADGFALKPSVKNRKWLDDVDTVAKTLKKLGFTDDQIWQKKLQTFKVVDTVAKRLNVDIPENLRPRPQSVDLVLTYEGDPAAVNPTQLTADFTASLKKIRQETEK